MSIQEKFLRFASEVGLSYILDIEYIKSNKDQIDILLVGSVATGLCNQHSDVDICILSSEEVVNKAPIENKWKKGVPTEVIIDGIQLHYYMKSIEDIISELKDYNESAYYLYKNSKLLYKGGTVYENLNDHLETYGKDPNRSVIAKKDLLARRRALKSVLEESKDPVLRMKMGLEMIQLLLATVALCDEISFDRRKRLYETSLKGQKGNKIKDEIDQLIKLISKISDNEDDIASSEFERLVDFCMGFMQLC